MIELVLGLALIIVLYARTFRYKRLIDDIVPMWGYLYEVPQQAPASDFYLQRTPVRHRLFAVGCHLLNTWLIYLLLGGKAALLFAVYPVAVNNVAWITGSYYSCTTFLTLTAYYFIVHTPWWIGLAAGAIFYGVALNTTVATISFPFVFLFGHPAGLVTLVSLVGFLRGRRFTVGRKIREDSLTMPKVHPDVFTVRRIPFMIKIVALYLYTAIVPLKLLFFRKFGARYRTDPDQRKDLEACNGLFWASLALIATFVVTGFVIGKLFWAMWFLILIGAFCQYKMLGQVFAERYLYPASIGLIAMLALLPSPYYWVLVGLYIMRSHFFISVFECNRTLYENGIKMDPEEASNYCNLSDWYFVTERNYTLAGHFMQETIKRDPYDYKGQSNMGSLWKALGNYEMALKSLLEAKKIAEGRCSPYIMGIIDNNIAFAQQQLEKKQVASV